MGKNDTEIHTFSKSINPEVDAVEQPEFEHAYSKAAVLHFIHYTTRTVS